MRLLAFCAALVWSISSSASVDMAQVGWEQKSGEELPLQLVMRDESNRPAELRSFFDRTPVVLVFSYFSCRDLCPHVLEGVIASLGGAGLAAGRDYRLLAVSIDPRDTAASAKQHRSHLLSDGSAVTFLTGADGAAQRLAEAAGFRYAYDKENELYAHAAGFLIASPRGEITRYFSGVQYSPDEVRASIIDAGRGRIAALSDRLMLLCYPFDPEQGRYNGVVMNALRIAAMAMLLLAGVLLRRLLRHGRA